MHIVCGRTYKSEIDFDWHDEIRKGLHSFLNYCDAETFCVGRIFDHDLAIFECVIPKGSTYYLGKFSCNEGYFDSYASTELKYVKKLKRFV